MVRRSTPTSTHMKNFVRVANAAVLLTLLSGCVIAIGSGGNDWSDNWKERQERNSAYIENLNLGHSLASIKADLKGRLRRPGLYRIFPT